MQRNLHGSFKEWLKSCRGHGKILKTLSKRNYPVTKLPNHVAWHRLAVGVSPLYKTDFDFAEKSAKASISKGLPEVVGEVI